MAFNDWNHDGENDWQDDFLEYQIYNDSTGNKNDSSYNSGGGMSTFDAALYTIISIVVGALIVSFFSGGNVENVPPIVIVIVIVICASVIGAFVSKDY